MLCDRSFGYPIVVHRIRAACDQQYRPLPFIVCCPFNFALTQQMNKKMKTTNGEGEMEKKEEEKMEEKTKERKGSLCSCW